MLQLKSQLADTIINTGKDIATAQKKRRNSREMINWQIGERTPKKTNECCNVLFMEMVGNMVSAPFKTNRNSKTTCHHLQWTPTISAS
jgi:hypothetical protein